MSSGDLCSPTLALRGISRCWAASATMKPSMPMNAALVRSMELRRPNSFSWRASRTQRLYDILPSMALTRCTTPAICGRPRGAKERGEASGYAPHQQSQWPMLPAPAPRACGGPRRAAKPSPFPARTGRALRSPQVPPSRAPPIRTMRPRFLARTGPQGSEGGTHGDFSASESVGHLSDRRKVRLRRRLCRGLQPIVAQPASLPRKPHRLHQPRIRCAIRVVLAWATARRAQASVDARSVPLPWPLCRPTCCALSRGRGS